MRIVSRHFEGDPDSYRETEAIFLLKVYFLIASLIILT